MSFKEVLCYGYMRKAEELLINNKQIIPESIFKICFKFYNTIQRILHLSTILNEGLYIASLDNKLYWKANINKGSVLMGDSDPLCYAENIKLPQSVKQDINIKTNNTDFNGIIHFRDSYRYKYKNIILFTENELFCNNESGDVIQTYKVKLPEIDIQHPCILNSDTHGIVTIGGGSQYMYYLKIDHDGKDWKWTKLSKMFEKKNCAACTVINGQYKNEKYFVVGGHCVDWLDTAQIYDCNEDKWSSLPNIKYKRCYHGIYCDSINNIVYIAGGNNNNGIDNLEYFDLEKNKWFHDLPPTTKQHNYRPIMWKEEDLLYIASCHSEIEFIDLRMKDKKWKNKSLSPILGSFKICSNWNMTERLLNLTY